MLVVWPLKHKSSYELKVLTTMWSWPLACVWSGPQFHTHTSLKLPHSFLYVCVCVNGINSYMCAFIIMLQYIRDLVKFWVMFTSRMYFDNYFYWINCEIESTNWNYLDQEWTIWGRGTKFLEDIGLCAQTMLTIIGNSHIIGETYMTI